MNTELQQLKDIHLPPAINMWPIAPGWIILFALLLSAIIFFFQRKLSAWLAFYFLRNKKKKAVKFALKKLGQLKSLMAKNPDDIHIAAEISTLIRRTALSYFHREEIAGLSGNEWLNFLNRSGNTDQFTQETGRLLIDAPYRKNITTDLAPLFVLTENWLITISKKKSILQEK